MSIERWPAERELFAEPGLRQVTVWCRGVLENKEARDVAVALAGAAALEGCHVQAWENYVDLPDRVNVPLRAYARISPEPIESRYIYENEEPDVVVLTEETLVKGNPILQGLKPGGVLVVNTCRDPKYIVGFLANRRNLARIACVDATGKCRAQVTLSGAEGATDATGVGAGLGGVLAGAVAKATGLVNLASLKQVAKNPEAVQYGYDQAVVHELPAGAGTEAGVEAGVEAGAPAAEKKETPFAGTVCSPQAENEGMVTGNWRTVRPVLDEEKCTYCLACWLVCPDACITPADDVVEFNYKYCKGCSLCTRACPVGALTNVPELEFAVEAAGEEE